MTPSLRSACFAVEQLKPCHGLSAPENGARSPEKRLHPAGATIHFSCAPGYVLKGQASIKCVPGHPSHWSDPPPICKAGECPVTPQNPPWPIELLWQRCPMLRTRTTCPCHLHSNRIDPWSPQSLPDPSDLASPRQMLEWALLGQILPMIIPLPPLPALVVWAIGLTHCPWPSPFVPASLDGFYNSRSLDGESPPLRAT